MGKCLLQDSVVPAKGREHWRRLGGSLLLCYRPGGESHTRRWPIEASCQKMRRRPEDSEPVPSMICSLEKARRVLEVTTHIANGNGGQRAERDQNTPDNVMRER